MALNFKIPIDELEITYVRSSGPGGQNVNKVSSKCQVRWAVKNTRALSPEQTRRFENRFSSKLTSLGELIVASDRFRDQKRNYEDCISKIEAMVSQILLPPKARRPSKPTRSSQRKRVESKRMHSLKKAMRGPPRGI